MELPPQNEAAKPEVAKPGVNPAAFLRSMTSSESSGDGWRCGQPHCSKHAYCSQRKEGTAGRGRCRSPLCQHRKRTAGRRAARLAEVRALLAKRRFPPRRVGRRLRPDGAGVFASGSVRTVQTPRGGSLLGNILNKARSGQHVRQRRWRRSDQEQGAGAARGAAAIIRRKGRHPGTPSSWVAIPRAERTRAVRVQYLSRWEYEIRPSERGGSQSTTVEADGEQSGGPRAGESSSSSDHLRGSSRTPAKSSPHSQDGFFHRTGSDAPQHSNSGWWRQV